jgi:hypothetical protein
VQLEETQHLALSAEERLYASEKRRLDEGHDLQQQLDSVVILLELQSRQTEAAEHRASVIRAQLAEALDLAAKNYPSTAEAWAAKEKELTSQIDRNESDLVVLSEQILRLECKYSRLLMRNDDRFAECPSPVPSLVESSPPTATFAVSNELELVLVPKQGSSESCECQELSYAVKLSTLASSSLCWSTTARLLEEFAGYHCAVRFPLHTSLSKVTSSVGDAPSHSKAAWNTGAAQSARRFAKLSS